MSTISEGRKLLRLEVRNSETPIERKPPWPYAQALQVRTPAGD